MSNPSSDLLLPHICEEPTGSHENQCLLHTPTHQNLENIFLEILRKYLAFLIIYLSWTMVQSTIYISIAIVNQRL